MRSPVRCLVSILPLLLCAPISVDSSTVTAGGLPAGIPNSPLLTLTGDVGDNFGGAVSSAGDINGDGYGDLVVGAELAGPDESGRAYVYFGSPGGCDAVPDLVLTGQPQEWFGSSVASAGDVNGDGFDDLLIGAVRSGIAGYRSGSAYVYFGGPALDGIADVVLRGPEQDDRFGISVASGDVNGDGFSDMVVGASRFDGGANDAGGTLVFFGGSTLDTVPDLVLRGRAAGDLLGVSVSSGDMNGDGYADIVCGAFAATGDIGEALVFFGGSHPDEVPDVVLSGESAGDLFGAATAAVGDVNGDGFGDILVGAQGNGAGGFYAGRAYIFYGGPTIDAVADHILTGPVPKEEFGVSVAGAGDLNGDGASDFIVGAPYGTAGADSGRAYVFLGGTGLDGTADAILSLSRDPGDVYAFGTAVALTGDLNRDGQGELVVGAPANTGPGKAFVYELPRTAVSVLVDMDPDVIDLSSKGRWVTAYIESHQIDVRDIDLSTLRLDDLPAEPKFGTIADHNADGWPDLMVKFGREALKPHLTLGPNRLRLTGRFRSGEEAEGFADVQVTDGSAGHLTASVLPNPLNQIGEFRVQATNKGVLRIRVFDIRGRLVRTLWDTQQTQPRTVQLPIAEAGLPSGVYLYRVENGGESLTGRFTILK